MTALIATVADRPLDDADALLVQFVRCRQGYPDAAGQPARGRDRTWGVQGHGRRRRPDTSVTDADVVVAGAGLAGLACAFELATAGREVLVLDAREVVGGRTSSWDDHGMAVESGLHRMLGVYRAMPKVLERAGSWSGC
jgi:NADPH-dependent 2,4-dienoyl-CoA reductase/sulfur reductase-like enzyme